MKYTRVNLAGIGYEIAPHVVTTDEIEQRLAPVYEKLRIQRGQLYALTGIRERRWWDPGQRLADPATRAAQRALDASGVPAQRLGAVVYAGVCRDQMEPATACAVADALGVTSECEVLDLSNACLGVMNGIIHVANAIELGQIHAGLVVSCETSRQIVDLTIDRMLASPDMQTFKLAMATMTGGSGAAAVVVTHESLAPDGHALAGGIYRAAPRFHELCRWGPDTGHPTTAPMVMNTDAVAVMENGVKLGVETYQAFIREMEWSDGGPDKVICHQVGAGHRVSVLGAMGIPVERDFSTFETFGNIGTVSLPLTAAIAEERGHLERGDRVGFLGIGSGLNCLMLGVNW